MSLKFIYESKQVRNTFGNTVSVRYRNRNIYYHLTADANTSVPDDRAASFPRQRLLKSSSTPHFIFVWFVKRQIY